MGFSSSQLEIREGESAVARFFIMSPPTIDVSLGGSLAHAGGHRTTADGEIRCLRHPTTHTCVDHTHTHTHTQNSSRVSFVC